MPGRENLFPALIKINGETNMNNKREQIRLKMQKILLGRNGMDILGRDVYILTLLLFIIELFLKSGIVYYICLLGFGYSIFRMLSKNISKRQRENQKYWAFKCKITGKINLQKRKLKERKTHRYFTCSNCHQTIRVPRGKGKIEIRCPRCNSTFIKKT